jgi:hypothetical protein
VQPVGGMDVEDADVGIPSDDPPYVPPFAGPLRGPRRRGSPARAARRAAPGHHSLATQVNLELTDLRGEPFIGYPSSPPSSIHQAVISACRQAGFTPRIRQEVGETSSLVALVAAGLGVALAPASVRHLRISGVTHRPLRGPAQATVMLAVAYKEGLVSPLIRGYLYGRRRADGQRCGRPLGRVIAGGRFAGGSPPHARRGRQYLAEGGGAGLRHLGRRSIARAHRPAGPAREVLSLPAVRGTGMGAPGQRDVL